MRFLSFYSFSLRLPFNFAVKRKRRTNKWKLFLPSFNEQNALREPQYNKLQILALGLRNLMKINSTLYRGEKPQKLSFN